MVIFLLLGGFLFTFLPTFCIIGVFLDTGRTLRAGGLRATFLHGTWRYDETIDDFALGLDRQPEYPTGHCTLG